MAVDIPAGKAVLGVTNQRLLVFGHSALSGKPKGLKAAFPIDQVQSITQEMGKMIGKLIVTFADGTTIDFDIVKTAKGEDFIEAFHKRTGR